MAKQSNEFGANTRGCGCLRGVVLFVLSTGIVSEVGSAQQKLSHAELVKLSRESCVRVWVNSRKGSGSGFFIDPNLVVTCCHVINENSVRPVDPSTRKFDPAKWHPYSDVNIVTIKGETIPVECNSVPTVADPRPGIYDFVVLKLKTRPKERYRVLPLCQNAQNLNVGDDVYFSGFPLSAPAMLTHKGMLSGITRGQVMLCIQAPVNQGNSGGALLNVQGEVIGIVNSKEGGIPERLDRARKTIAALKGQNVLSVTLAGETVNFLTVDKDTIDILEYYISTGIGYAINTQFLRGYIQSRALIKPAAGGN